MASTPPAAIAFLIATAVALVGITAAMLRRRATFRGYEAIQRDVASLCKLLRGQVFRDGDDLAIAGTMGKLPVQARFSHAQNTPGMVLRMNAASALNLLLVPKAADADDKGGAVVRTGEEYLDNRFIARTDQPAQARMLFGPKPTQTHMRKLCCSSNTSVRLSHGAIEVAELLIPAFLSRHAGEHIESMQALATVLEKMPGGDKVKVMPLPRQGSGWLTRAAVAAGVIAAATLVYSATKHPVLEPIFDAPDPATVAGVRPIDSRRIPQLDRFRVATTDEINLAVRRWASSAGVQASGRVEGEFSGRRTGIPEAAYLLQGSNGERRVVLVADGLNRYDAEFPELDGVVRIPGAALQNLEWAAKPQVEPDGDALLIIRKADDVASGLIVFLHEGRLASGIPANYQSVSLR